jgi:hypothetical protein
MQLRMHRLDDRNGTLRSLVHFRSAVPWDPSVECLVALGLDARARVGNVFQARDPANCSISAAIAIIHRSGVSS